MQIDLDIPGAHPRTDADMMRVDRLNALLGQKDQLMAEVRRHLRLNPKPHQNKVTLPGIIDRFDHTTKQRKPTVNSFVAGRNIHRWQNPLDQVETNPFSALPSETDVVTKNLSVSRPQPPPLDESCMVKQFCVKPCIFDKINLGHCRNEQNLKGKTRTMFGDKDTLNGCKVNKQLERLQVPSFPLPPSMLDYQSDYFTSTKGRPLKEGFKRSEFSKMQRTAFFKTLMTSFIKDDVCRRKEQYKLDMWELDSISRELDLVKKTFKKFIELSNEDSVALVKDQLHAGHMREEVEAKLAAHKGILSSIKTDIFRYESQLSTLLLCRDLLLKLSPSAWRMKYEHDAAKFTVKNKWQNELSVLYKDYCRYYPEPGKDFFLDEAMELLLKAAQTMGPPSIYFTESWQISMVLRKKELNCISQIGDIVDLERKIAEIDKQSKELTKYRASEMKRMSEQMDKGRAEFEYQKRRVAELEAAANKLIPKYVDTLFSGDIVLETTALIELLYTDFFGQSRQFPEPVQMMIEIERAIRLQKEEFLEIDPQIVRYFEKKVDAEAKKKDRAALRAKRVYREAKMFVKAAQNMYIPPPRGPRTWKIPVRRSMVPHVKKKKSRMSVKWEETFQHYQVNGILMNDEVEENLDKAIAAYCGLPFQPISPVASEDSAAEHSSILSCASTESLERAADDKTDPCNFWRITPRPSEVDQKDDLMVIEMGYDSDEELIKQNYEKKKGLSDKPAVLYDAKMLDERFMVESDDVKLTNKDRRRVSRDPPPTYKNNPLSWR